MHEANRLISEACLSQSPYRKVCVPYPRGAVNVLYSVRRHFSVDILAVPDSGFRDSAVDSTPSLSVSPYAVTLN